MAATERMGLLLACSGMGDCLYSIPVIKKLKQISGDRYVFDLFTYHPDLFVSCPYIENVFKIEEDPPAQLPENYPHKVQRLFDLKALPFIAMETIDFISVGVGIGQLSFREKTLEYFPTETDQAEQYDIVINTSMTWESRSWPIDHWQRLASILLDKGYSVAVVGKDVRGRADNVLKSSIGLDGCVDLVNKLSLDQTFYTLAKCKLFISCQNGLSVVSAATDAEIIVLDQSIVWSKRAIFRHEDPHYKVTYVKGNCDIYCASSFECPRKEHMGQFLCIPTFDKVLEAVLKKLP